MPRPRFRNPVMNLLQFLSDMCLVVQLALLYPRQQQSDPVQLHSLDRAVLFRQLDQVVQCHQLDGAAQWLSETVHRFQVLARDLKWRRQLPSPYLSQQVSI
jgi:hypothetical protein